MAAGNYCKIGPPPLFCAGSCDQLDKQKPAKPHLLSHAINHCLFMSRINKTTTESESKLGTCQDGRGRFMISHQKFTILWK